VVVEAAKVAADLTTEPARGEILQRVKGLEEAIAQAEADLAMMPEEPSNVDWVTAGLGLVTLILGGVAGSKSVAVVKVMKVLKAVTAGVEAFEDEKLEKEITKVAEAAGVEKELHKVLVDQGFSKK